MDSANHEQSKFVSASERAAALVLAALVPFSALVPFAWFTRAHFVTTACDPGMVENHRKFATVPLWMWWTMLVLQALMSVGFLSLPIAWLFRARLTTGVVHPAWTTARRILAVVVLLPFIATVVWALSSLVRPA